MRKQGIDKIGNKWVFCAIGLLFVFVTGCAQLQSSLTTPTKHNFRATRWGNSKAAVLFAERGLKKHFDNGDTLVFKYRYRDIPILLVYCFRGNQLRAAGYLTNDSVPLSDPDRLFRKELFEMHGNPTKTFSDGGMLWDNKDTLIYVNVHAVSTSNIRTYDLSDAIGINPSSGKFPSLKMPKSQHLKKWQGVCAYIDTNFYNMISEKENARLALAELSRFEEILLGFVRKVSRHRIR